MKPKQLMLSIIILLTFLFVLPAYAVFCFKCGTQNPDNAVYCSKCGSKLYHPAAGEKEADLYKRSSDLIAQEKWEQVISLLEPSPSELKRSILLAQAYLGKCELLKEQGDEAYKYLVLLPFNTGEGLMSHHNLHVQSEGFYLVAYSLFVNDRKARAIKHLEKALEISSSFSKPEVRYFLLYGRIKLAQGAAKHDDLAYMAAIKVFEKIIDMDVENEYKALSCFWLGKLYLRWSDKKKAISSFNNALNYAEYESTRVRIQNQLASNN